MPRTTPGRAGRRPGLACALATLLLLGAAALGWRHWHALPAFPPPAANDVLLMLRRGCTVSLGCLGLASVPRVVRPGSLPLFSVYVYVLGVFASALAVAALRGSAEAPILWFPAVACAAATLTTMCADSTQPGARSAAAT